MASIKLAISRLVKMARHGLYNLVKTPGLLLNDLMQQSAVIVSGGVVTQGAGHTLNITACVGYADADIQQPDTGSTATLKGVRVSSTLQTNLALSGTTNDGVTVHYVKLQYAQTGEPWPDIATRSFAFVVNTTANTSKDILLNTFTTNGTTITFLGGRSPAVPFSADTDGNLISAVSLPVSQSHYANRRYVDSRATGYKRQTVISGRKGSVHADFLENATGLAVTLKASSTDPLIASIAAGFAKMDTGIGAPVDYIIHRDSDLAFSSLQANATNFLALKRDAAGVVTPVTSLLPPVYGNVFSSDRENKINASFNGTHGDTEFVDPYGNMFKAYGTGWQISNVNQYSGMNTLRCNGVNNIISNNRCEVITSLDTRSLDQWTLEGFFYADAMNLLATQPIFTAYPSGAPSGGIKFTLRETDGTPSFSLSSNESTADIWASVSGVPMSGVASRATFGDINTGGTFGMPLQPARWYHFAWVFDGLRHRVYLNGYLVCVGPQFNNSEVFSYLKPGNFNKIWLGAEPANLANKLAGNISNFAFHPYAKYQTKKFAVSGDAPSVRDIFTPPSVPLSLTTQSDRYYNESEAIYLDFESAADGDVLTKDLYGRQLTCFGNDNATLTRGGYIESGAAKFGTKSLYFSGVNTYNNGAYIKAPVWADKWTVEFWGKKDSVTASTGWLMDNVVPGVLSSQSFAIFISGNGSSNRININLGSTDSSADIMSFSEASYTRGTSYIHIAVSYDGITYRVFADAVLINSVVSQLKICDGVYFLFGRASANSNHLDGKIDDFAYVPYCKYTAGFTPPATALLSSMPDQYVFDTKKMQMYKGFPSAFTAENTVFVGEALTSVAQVEKVITYALNGEYWEEFSSDQLGNLVTYLATRRHNLGVALAESALYAKVIGGSLSATLKGELIEVMSLSGNGTTIDYTVPAIGVYTRLLNAIHFGNNTSGPDILFAARDGNVVSIFKNLSHTANLVAVTKRSF